MTISILFQNFADTALLSGGAYVLPREHAQDPDIGLMARTTNAAAASTVLILDLGGARPVGGVALGPINASPGATYRIKAYSDVALTALEYDSGVRTFTGSLMDWSDPDVWLEWEDDGFWFGVLGQWERQIIPSWLIEVFATQQWQYWKIELSDEANQDGYIQFGRVFLGRKFSPEVDYSGDNEFAAGFVGDSSESLAGRRDYWRRGIRRSARFALPDLSHGEAFDSVFRLMTAVSLDNQIFVVPDFADDANIQKRSFLATFRVAPALTQTLYGNVATVIDAEEVL